MNNKQQTVGIQQLTREQNASAPFFSIIIPVYNVAPYLRDCLDSVLAQTFTDWECLCVDDGSTDESGAILDEYAQKDVRFRVFHKPNGGVSAARNLALDNVKGEWVWFVDGDDMIHPESLGWLCERLKAHPNVKTFSITNQQECENFKDGVWKSLPSCGVWENFVYTSKGLRFHRRAGWATLFKRDAIGDTRFKPFTIGEDVLFQMELFWTYPCGLYAETPLYYYRTREESAVTSRPTIKKVSDLLMTEYEMLNLFKQNKAKWYIEKVYEYARWNETFVWVTFRAMFFRLKLSEMKQLLPLWCQVQTLQHELFGARISRKVCLKVIKLTNSSLLCSWLVFFKSNLKKKLRACLLALGLLEWVKRFFRKTTR